jgi:5-methylcytosine-specific restriction endonuclease McrA
MTACAAPITKGILRGQMATGTKAGYQRHVNAGEPSCLLCLAANRLHGREFYQNNPEPGRERAKRYYRDNTARAKANVMRYKARIPVEKEQERLRRWQREHPERRRESRRRWREANREKMAAYSNQRRARLRSVLSLPYTAEQLNARMSMFAFRCWMCGGPYEETDHVKPLIAGGPDVLANLRPACKSCNSSKGGQWPIPLQVIEENRVRKEASA